VTRNILIVDADETFATMLCQCLQQMDGIRADVVAGDDEALGAVAAGSYDLAIVDLGLPDGDPQALVRTLCMEHPDLCLMVMPLEGETIPAELEDLSLRGALPKPFFLPELPERIENALSSSPSQQALVVDESLEERAPGSGMLSLLEEQHAVVSRLMTRLAQEVGAEAVLLTRETELLVQTSRLPQEEIDALVSVVCDSWHTSARVAKILGQEQLRFEQSIEGEQHLLYSLALADDLILSVVVQGKVALGMIRHRAKETAEEIREAIGA